LARAIAGLRSSILGHVRLPVCLPAHTQRSLGGALSIDLVRGFAEGTYLSKEAVTERVLAIVKNFDKVEPGKVSTLLGTVFAIKYI
jgi:NADH dehydrogenase (ubiquinone) 1 alpha/beta subcomplex 1, acyl-carrier protein